MLLLLLHSTLLERRHLHVVYRAVLKQVQVQVQHRTVDRHGSAIESVRCNRFCRVWRNAVHLVVHRHLFRVLWQSEDGCRLLDGQSRDEDHPDRHLARSQVRIAKNSEVTDTSIIMFWYCDLVRLFSSQLSGVLIISVPGEIYLYGSQYFMIVLCMILVVLILNHVILPVFFENQITNCYEVDVVKFSSIA